MTQQHVSKSTHDLELMQKASALKDSSLFVGTCEGAELVDKQQIFLVLAGEKPVAEACSAHLERTSTGQEYVADDEREVGRFLESLGLSYSLWQAKHFPGTMAAVSLRPELVHEYREAKGGKAVGALLGYPKTAVEAYAKNNCLPIDEQEMREREAGIGWDFVPFRFSRKYWREEAETAKRWYDILKNYRMN